MVSRVKVACQTVSENVESHIRSTFPELPYRLGLQDHICQHCGALRWGEERTNANVKRDEETYSNCCQQGSVSLPWGEFDGPTLPEMLQKLYMGPDPGECN